MNRRQFLHSSAAAAAALTATGCHKKPILAKASTPTLPPYDTLPYLAPIRAHTDRLFRITVCIRPFRAEGPRIEPERVGDKLVIHHYGHGGSGWSLSWGSAALVVPMAMADGQRDIAVIGCGAIGLTTAAMLQRAGARVTIYAKERPPEVRSSRATGSWTPDSRIALTANAAPDFAAKWEKMARTSWAMYQGFLGMAGTPVEYSDRYAISALHPDAAIAKKEREDPIGFARYNHLLDDLTPKPVDYGPGEHPWPTDHCRRFTSLQFNIADYSRQLITDFQLAGGKIETAEFHTPADFAALPQKVIVNCTGYGARALFNDNSITPVRGQIGWLIPQPEVNYGIYYENLNILSRRDGIVVQSSEQGEASGWNDTNEQPDRREAEDAVRLLATLYAGMKPQKV